MGIFKKLFNMLVIGHNDFKPPTMTPPARITGTHKDASGRTVLEVQAASYLDAARLTDGITLAGDVSKAIVSVGGNKWEIRAERFNPPMNPSTMTRKKYQEYIDKARR